MENNIENSFAGRWLHSIVINLRRIMVFCFVIALATSVWMLTRKQLWTVSALTVVPGGQQSMAGLSGIGGLAGSLLSGKMGGPGSILGMGQANVPDMNLVYQVLISRTVSERVIFKYHLLAEYKVPTMDDALLKFRKSSSVLLTAEGFFIVSVEADNREKAAAMVNDIVEFANEELSTIITSRARRSRIAAEEYFAEASESLAVAQDRMEQFREETGLLFPEEQGVQTMNLLSSLETELLLAEADLAGVSGTMSSSSPVYSEIARRVASLRSSTMDRAAGDSVSYFPGLDSMPAMLKEYENIAIDVETRRAVYLLIRQELESLKLEEAKDSPSIEVLSPAVPSALRSYPKRGITVIKYSAIAFLLSLLWMAVITYARQLLDDENSGPFWRNVIRISRSQLFLQKKKDRNGTP